MYIFKVCLTSYQHYLRINLKIKCIRECLVIIKNWLKHFGTLHFYPSQKKKRRKKETKVQQEIVMHTIFYWHVSNLLSFGSEFGGVLCNFTKLRNGTACSLIHDIKHSNFGYSLPSASWWSLEHDCVIFGNILIYLFLFTYLKKGSSFTNFIF